MSARVQDADPLVKPANGGVPTTEGSDQPHHLEGDLKQDARKELGYPEETDPSPTEDMAGIEHGNLAVDHEKDSDYSSQNPSNVTSPTEPSSELPGIAAASPPQRFPSFRQGSVEQDASPSPQKPNNQPFPPQGSDTGAFVPNPAAFHGMKVGGNSKMVIHYPPHLMRENQFDITVMCIEEDMSTAREVKSLLLGLPMKGYQHTIGVHVLDEPMKGDFSWVDANVDAIDVLIKHTTCIYLLLSKTFCEDHWGRFAKNAVLMQMINQQNAVTTVYTERRKESNYVPATLRSVVGYEVQKLRNDEHTQIGVTRCIEGRKGGRLERLKLLDKDREQYDEKHGYREQLTQQDYKNQSEAQRYKFEKEDQIQRMEHVQQIKEISKQIESLIETDSDSDKAKTPSDDLYMGAEASSFDCLHGIQPASAQGIEDSPSPQGEPLGFPGTQGGLSLSGYGDAPMSGTQPLHIDTSHTLEIDSQVSSDGGSPIMFASSDRRRSEPHLEEIKDARLSREVMDASFYSLSSLPNKVSGLTRVFSSPEMYGRCLRRMIPGTGWRTFVMPSNHSYISILRQWCGSAARGLDSLIEEEENPRVRTKAHLLRRKKYFIRK